MNDEIVLSVTLSVHPGQVEAFREAVVRLVAKVESIEPRLSRYQFFVSDDGTVGRAIHVYEDSAALEYHVGVSAEPIAEVLQYATLTNIEILGNPTPAALDKAGGYVPSSVVRTVAEFVRRP
jgi:quinol monooxygenase YgiN